MYCANVYCAHMLCRESVDLLAFRQRDQFATLQTAMTVTLTEVIRKQVSMLPRWPAAVDEALQNMYGNSLPHVNNQRGRFCN